MKGVRSSLPSLLVEASIRRVETFNLEPLYVMVTVLFLGSRVVRLPVTLTDWPSMAPVMGFGNSESK